MTTFSPDGSPRMRPATSYPLSPSRTNAPLHFRQHSDDERHHWSVDVVESRSFLPSPPYSLSVAYPSPPVLPAATLRTHRTLPPTARPSTSPHARFSPSPTLASRQSSSYNLHLQRHRLLLSDLLSPGPPPPRPLYHRPSDRDLVDLRRSRRATHGDPPTLIERSTSSVERVHRQTLLSERRATRVVHERRAKEQAAREAAEAAHRRRASYVAEEEKGDDGDDVPQFARVPAGFYYAKQFDFFSTVKSHAEKQRRAMAARRRSSQGGGAEETKEDAKPASRGVSRAAVAKGRTTDWQVDAWWEAQHYADAVSTAGKDGPSADEVAAPCFTPHRPSTASFTAVPLLVSDGAKEPSYVPVTPLYLSRRADYTAFLPSLPHHLALNALQRPPPSRSTLERGLLERWVKTLPLFGEVEGGEGGAELLGVSQVVRKAVGDGIYEEGEIGVCMYVLLEGEVRLDRRDERPRSAGQSRPAVPATLSAKTRVGTPTLTSRRGRPSTAHPGGGSGRSSVSSLAAPAIAADPTPAQMAAPVLLHPYVLFGARRTDGGGAPAASTALTSPASVVGAPLRGWARVRWVLRFSRSFQMSHIGRMAEARIRQDSARCTEESVLLCIAYSDYDRVSRAHRDRQSRLTLSSFRAMDGLTKLRMRSLHRLGKLVTARRLQAGEFLISPDASPASAVFFLTAGTMTAVKAVEALSYHRQPTSYKGWEWQEARQRRRVHVRVDCAPCVLGQEALLGVRQYDVGWRATTACEVYGLARRDFHLLCAPALLEGVRERVGKGREELRRAVERSVVDAERASAEEGHKKPRRVRVDVRITPNDGDLTNPIPVIAHHDRAVRRSLAEDELAAVSTPALYQQVLAIVRLSAFLPGP